MGAVPFARPVTGTATGASIASATGAMAGSLFAGLLRAAVLLRAAGLEAVVLTRHLLRYPTGLLPERPPLPAGRSYGPARGGAACGAEPDGPPPVLLLHGFADNRSVFAPLARSLRRHGWEHVEGVNYSLLICDVRHAAEALGRRVERLCEGSGHRRVDIVGHSLGGLIARYYVQRLGGDARVRSLVTLGTPHSGTRAVSLANTHPIVRQMRPNSELMVELAAPATGCATFFTAFWSDCDQLMVPAEAARLDHPDLAVRNVAIQGMGHLTMPLNGAVAALVCEILRGDDPRGRMAGAA